MISNINTNEGVSQLNRQLNDYEMLKRRYDQGGISLRQA